MEIKDIEPLVAAYAAAHNKLSGLVAELNDEMTAAKKRRLKAIKEAVATAKERQAVLETAINDSRYLFDKPRTRIMHGIRLGLQKQKGSISYEDASKVIALIRKHLPDQADVLIKTEEIILKQSLAALTVADLRRIGVEVEEAGDKVIIKAVDGDVEKLVTALLKDDHEE